MDYTLLKSEAAIDADCAKLVPAPAGLIPRRSIKIALLGLGKLAAVSAAIPAYVSDPDFDQIDVLDPLTQSVFGELVTGGVITADDLAAINALGTVQIPRWQALGFEREPDFADIARANQS
jgi:hypothetical protein